ncbi:VirB4 family type IV secretion/conjugal transfer ATPase [Allorhizobium sp. BGMRC 0089]|uniref:VirB4 family type IV secretion/conjugal transfer ATPase n=1 Tax=Allorhizobium sonneratiae TaxID=2934936 RepID=UPI002033AA1C|nr:VirB4 family type IV secretion/conjugal transfer ATPase [Allorhizobium sonneratiae]MCM2294706.1 VirB4 family type IV secretion/conjugal transfer ATPase [Allorhizobium sonneratiae]
MLKFLKDGLQYGSYILKDRSIGMHIPFRRHVNHCVVTLENGAIAGTIKLDGLHFQTIDQSRLNSLSEHFNTILKSFGSSKYSIWSTIIRKKINIENNGKFQNNFCQNLNDKYFDMLQEKNMFTNEIYLTVVVSEQKGVLGLVDRLNRFSSGRGRSRVINDQDQDVVDLTERLQTMKEELRAYGPHILSIVEREDGFYSEPCEFFNALAMMGVDRKMRLPRMPINEYIGQARLFFSKRTIELSSAVEEEKRFGQFLSIKEYPPFTAPGMLNNLLHVGQEFILTQSFSLVDKPMALERITRIQRQISSSDARDSSVEDDVSYARNALLNQESVFGNYHMSLLAITRDYDGLSKTVSELARCLTEANIAWVREDLNCEPSFWAQFPGNHAYIARSAMLSSANIAGLASMHNFPVGNRTGLKWGEPICVFETTSQTPFFFSFHNEGGLGHFLVTGKSGSGKTVALAFLLSQAFRVRPRPKAVFFDKDRGAEVFIRAMGGQYEILNPDFTTGFNPLQIKNTNENRVFLTNLFKIMLEVSGGPDAAEEEQILERAIGAVLNYPKAQRRLSYLQQLVQGQSKGHANDLASRLQSWVDGDKAWVFNSDTDMLNLDEKRILGFDMSKIFKLGAVRGPILMYLFHRLQELLDGDPVMVFMDEGWQLLNDSAFTAFIRDMLNTFRKRNAIVGFGTQSPNDIAASPIGHTLIEQTAVHLHFPNDGANRDAYINDFNLSEKEFYFVQNSVAERRCFLIKSARSSVIARLDLSGMPDYIKVLSGGEKAVLELDRLRAEFGDDPQNWLPHFMGKA